MIIESMKPEDTFSLGYELGKKAQAGDVFLLEGDLGVGKTVFTQGFASGLEILEPVNSPTFTIVQEYEEGRIPFYHFDVYRIGDIEEMDEIGYEDYFYGNGVCLIEWANLITEILPENARKIMIEKDLEKGFDYRRITVEEEKMKILAIDSSGITATVSLVFDGVMIAEYTTNFKKTHSQTLLPMIDEIVKMTETKLDELDAIAVAAGPGSFTGLRIGSSTAKGLGLVLKKPIIPVPTVEGLAYNLFGSDRVICPIMDARRNQVYTGLYSFAGDKFQILSDQKAVSIEEIISEVNTLGRPSVFLGDGVPVFKEKIKELAKVDVMFAPAHMCMQRAAAVAVRGEALYREGVGESAEEHKPVYLRKSQAEREREAAQKGE